MDGVIKHKTTETRLKLFFTALLSALMMSSASLAQTNGVATLQGVVEIETHWTATCMAIGCPPSQPYLQAFLKIQLAGHSPGLETSTRVLLAPITGQMSKAPAPREIIFQQRRISEGMFLQITGLYRRDLEMVTSISQMRVIEQRQLTTLLEYSNLAIPYSENRLPGTKIVVEADGKVIRTDYQGKQAISSQLVRKLNAVELRDLQNLLRQAQSGTTQLPDMNSPICLAMPSHNVRIAGLNGDLLLLEGAFPCGRTTKNTSAAATRLIQWIQAFGQQQVQAR